MRVSRRPTLFAALCVAPLLLLRPAGRRAAFCAGLPGDATAPLAAAQQFYTRVLGDWVGTAISRLNGDEPATAYFHLVIARVEENTFREEYTFYRIHPKSGALERSGTQSVLSTIDSSAVIHQTCRGSGTVLIDLKEKNESFEASGQAHFTGPDHLEAEVKGKIAVDGMPLNLGKNGKLRKATAAWSLEDDQLIGRTRVETSFRVFLFAKRFLIETQLRAQRGADLQTVTGRATPS
jgi:hypothetical protein